MDMVAPWSLRPEEADDEKAVDALVTLCFGAGRFAKTAWRLREGVAPVRGLSFVATKGAEESLLGSVRFWPVKVGSHSCLLLGPLAVRPDLRGQGIGIGLMQHGLEAARKLPYECIILVGDEPYYAKVGFARLPPGRVSFPGPVDPDRVLGLSLVPGALLSLSGMVRRAAINVPVSAQSAPLG
jgi:predicted N-acetyltransferase YhbS